MAAGTGEALRESEAVVVPDPDKVGIAAGKIINKRKVAKHIILDMGEGSLSWRRDQESIDAEAATDGIYVIRAPIPPDTWTCAPSSTVSGTGSAVTC